MSESLRVRVCYALPDHVFLKDLALAPGTTLQEAIAASGLLAQETGIDLASARVGVHGKLKSLDTVLREGDRIEVYRTLQADPKDARRRRVVKERKAQAAR